VARRKREVVRSVGFFLSCVSLFDESYPRERHINIPTASSQQPATLVERNRSASSSLLLRTGHTRPNKILQCSSRDGSSNRPTAGSIDSWPRSWVSMRPWKMTSAARTPFPRPCARPRCRRRPPITTATTRPPVTTTTMRGIYFPRGRRRRRRMARPLVDGRSMAATTTTRRPRAAGGGGATFGISWPLARDRVGIRRRRPTSHRRCRPRPIRNYRPSWSACTAES